MPVIPIDQIRAALTQSLGEVYNEMMEIRSTSFLRTFFPTKESFARFVSIEVIRGSERVAVDVIRGTEGNRNTFSKSTQKVIDPPMFREYFDITHLDIYDRIVGSTSIDDGMFTMLQEEIAEKMRALVDKIERAYELQAAQVLQTGIITLKNGDNIDYLRKAASLVNTGAGTYWATGTVDPSHQLQEGAEFLRKVGKAQGGTFPVLCGADALNDLIQNDLIKSRADIKSFKLDDIIGPQRTAVGSNYHGRISGGSWNFDIWTYSEFYDELQPDGTTIISKPYIDPKKIVMLGGTSIGKTMFGAVPQLLGNGPLKRGAYVFGDYQDERKVAHEFDVQSAGVVVPVKIDQIYTRQVVAS